ncbi:ornithine carbamoyltransferase [Planobispora longispora]|uniref:Ornithine carbamoyltransferase n=1 Tax=Planobispora longispora TaxID=28887 RepID=A0A8J3RVR4_9ACTN|nr:ornithine carbamoyltransferase [Planobispora longispora]GIH80817.1 ornithine carbamoyltransferase [Planobispora longispora]
MTSADGVAARAARHDSGTARHLLTLADLTAADLDRLVERGCAIAAQVRAGDPALAGTLHGRVAGVYFTRTSTRTRTAFSSAALRLGAGLIAYGPGDLQLNTGETIEDTGRVLSGMLDVLVVRTAGPVAEMAALAAQRRMAVVNAMSAEEHPTQALADLTTMRARFGALPGLRVLYVGEGNNTAAALSLALTRYPGTELHLRTPPGYGLPPATALKAEEYGAAGGALLVERHDMARLPQRVDVVYTTRWQTTGTTKPDPDWRAAFAPFQVNETLMDRYPDALFLHDLPAHRGEEVTAGVLDGPRSVAFEQAENKLYSAMAVLEWAAGGARW